MLYNFIALLIFLFTWYLDLAPLPAHPRRLFFDIAGLFACFVLFEYIVCSVLIEHVQRFESQVGCSQRDSVL